MSVPLICIAGKNRIAVECARYLSGYVPINQLVVCANKTDTGNDTWQPSLKKWAADASVSERSLAEVSAAPSLIFFSLEFDKIINVKKFQTKNLFNIHFSLLPEYKGMYTSIWPILEGKSYSGVSLHRIDRGIDTGDLIAQEKFSIPEDMRSRDLYDVYLRHGIELFKTWVHRIIEGNYDVTPQSSSGSSYRSASSIDFQNVEIDLNQTAETIHNQIRAFCFPEYQLPKVFSLNVSKSRITRTRSEKPPGTIVSQTESSVTIATIDFDIEVTKDPFSQFISGCESGDLESAESALGRIENLEEQNSKGWTPLMVAAYHGIDKFVKTAIDRGANVNAKNFKGTTVLMYGTSGAIRTNRKESLVRLLNSGADTSIRDHSGRTVTDYEENHKNDEVIRLLSGSLHT